MLIACLVVTLLAVPITGQTAADRAWARASRIHAQVHALTHRVHEYHLEDDRFTSEDDATTDAASSLQADLRKLSIDAALAFMRHSEHHPRALAVSDPELTRLNAISVLSLALQSQCEVIVTATLDKRDSRWRTLLPPACALTEAALARYRSIGRE